MRKACLAVTVIVLMILPISSMSRHQKNMEKVYYQGQYASTHWAMKPFTLEDNGVIALLKYHRLQYVVLLHPHDKRGYRCIIRLIDNEHMASTFNRPFTPKETKGLSIITEAVTQAYETILPVAQSFKLGNNSQTFDKRLHRVQFGNAKEPSILHTHVMGRGDPSKDYIPGVPLDGPMLGTLFLFETYDKTVPGNDARKSWTKAARRKVTLALRDALNQVIKTNPNLKEITLLVPKQETTLTLQ